MTTATETVMSTNDASHTTKPPAIPGSHSPSKTQQHGSKNEESGGISGSMHTDLYQLLLGANNEVIILL